MSDDPEHSDRPELMRMGEAVQVEGRFSCELISRADCPGIDRDGPLQEKMRSEHRCLQTSLVTVSGA